MSRLYIVEGLPCSGKSTTAKFIADTLTAQGKAVRYVDEGTGNHPADYEFHALIDGQVVPLSDFPPEDLPALLPIKRSSVSYGKNALNQSWAFLPA